MTNTKSPFELLRSRGSMFAVFVRTMLVCGYQNVVTGDYLAAGEEVPLRECQQQALDDIEALGGKMASATIGVYTAQMKNMHLITTRRRKSHYYMVLTDLGSNTLEKLVKNNPTWGTTLDPAKVRAGLTEEQKEIMLDQLLVDGFHEMPFVDRNERSEESRQQWSALYDEYMAKNVTIFFVETGGKVTVSFDE